MAYLAIYRKYRPVSFDKLIGQQHIVRTLTNQIKFDRVSHAYLFTGTRGTGKTSAARIFARAINCLHPVDGNPCNECAVCKELVKQNSMDIVEIDAASNNGVDAIRDLREKVGYMPSVGKYKVYIIDEVHMLTDSAYNALLKTLEEPPKHVVFILCTTEVQKMPATILSRCLRFDFELVGIDELNSLMSGILDDVGVEYTKEAVNAVAAAGEGSVRDALSVLDRCVAFAEGKLEYNDVLQILGATDKNKIYQLAEAIFTRDVAGVLELVDSIAKSGKSISVLAKDIAVYIRDMLICQKCQNPKQILTLPEDIYQKLVEQSQKYDQNRLLFALDVFNKVEAELRYAIDPRVTFEVACLKVANDDRDEKIVLLERRLAQIEKNGVLPRQTKAVMPEQTNEQIHNKDYAQGRMVWARVLKQVRNSDSFVLSSACQDMDNMYVCDGDFVLVVNEAQHVLLTQTHHNKTLGDIVFAERKLNLKLVKTDEKRSTVQDDLKDMQHLIGKDKLKIV